MASEGFFSQLVDEVKKTASLLHKVEDQIIRLLYCDDLDESEREWLFAEIMWIFVLVMDHCHYALHHNIQNERERSHRQGVKNVNVKTPCAQKLKWSADRMRDEQPECSLRRKNFVTTHCKTIFGEHYHSDQRIPDSYLKEFQENALSLQAVIEVDQAGVPVKICQHNVQQCPCTNKVSSLVRAQKYEYETPDDQRCFNPSRIHFENLESVRMPVTTWSETTLFNLLHYFRNCTTHRYFISLHKKVSIFLGHTLWISVPEITDLRDENNTQSFHEHPLYLVLLKLFYFVIGQRRKMLSIEDDEFVNSRIEQCKALVSKSTLPYPTHEMTIYIQWEKIDLEEDFKPGKLHNHYIKL